MFRSLARLRNNIQMPRNNGSGYTSKANFVTCLRLLSRLTDAENSDISVSDINIYDLAKEDQEFSRNFLTTMPSLEQSVLSSITPAGDVNATVGPETGEAATEPESSVSSEANIDGSATSQVLDRDGNPVVPIEIDGWKDIDEDELGPALHTNSQHIEIGNDNEYKREKALEVPEKREGSFEYKGIKIKLPEKASKDIGTYRFRRDIEDLKTVADDMRVVKFDIK
ncbi:uncharacterized protein LOC6562884 [Drosophila grimshawi]|uniref:GH10855 n=1 Tax=Drosophila grimshawi TaxID=7222 RepID=B4JAI3_DROGR|nr:uncharacterized protein LOC6562884 [Drosophila grimshawi]EDW02769.1 GH10855 [Drosophila grimshawi]